MDVLNNFLNDVTDEIKKLGINIKRIYIKDGFLTLKVGNRDIKIKEIPKLNENISYTITQILDKFLANAKNKIERLRDPTRSKNKQQQATDTFGIISVILFILLILVLLTHIGSRYANF